MPSPHHYVRVINTALHIFILVFHLWFNYFRQLVRCISVNGDLAAVGCIDPQVSGNEDIREAIILFEPNDFTKEGT